MPAAAILCLALVLSAHGLRAEDLAAQLASTALALRDALPDAQRAELVFPFDDDEREDIRFAPFLLEGVRHGELAEEPAALAEQLLALSLSPRGLAGASLIRRSELAVAKKDEGRWVPAWIAGRLRDPGRYFVALFGDPGSAEPFAFRYEGHHLSLNVAVQAGAVPATTPLFVGAEPRVLPAGDPDAGMAVLGEEEAAARALVAALPEPLRARALLPYEDGRALLLGQVRRAAAAPAVGVARAELPPAARAELDRLLELFAGRFARAIARERLAEIDAAGRDAMRFAWAEAEEPPGAFYLRLAGPRTLIEIDNTTDGDHVHAVWHDLAGDFGDDLLAAHLARDHGLVLASPR